jgi:hypothetical protein
MSSHSVSFSIFLSKLKQPSAAAALRSPRRDVASIVPGRAGFPQHRQPKARTKPLLEGGEGAVIPMRIRVLCAFGIKGAGLAISPLASISGRVFVPEPGDFVSI